MSDKVIIFYQIRYSNSTLRKSHHTFKIFDQRKRKNYLMRETEHFIDFYFVLHSFSLKAAI